VSSWHAALFPTGYSGLSKITVGDWRKDLEGAMQVVSGPFGKETVHYEAPPADRLKDEMGRFLDWFNSDYSMDPLLKAAVAHLWFVTIHPLDDGNVSKAARIRLQSQVRLQLLDSWMYRPTVSLIGQERHLAPKLGEVIQVNRHSNNNCIAVGLQRVMRLEFAQYQELL
jgi:hypothetical protein